jgi:hypothetical protein
MHEDDKDDHKGGDVEWFVSTDGADLGVNTIRVIKMTNRRSSTPLCQSANTRTPAGPIGTVAALQHFQIGQPHKRSSTRGIW